MRIKKILVAIHFLIFLVVFLGIIKSSLFYFSLLFLNLILFFLSYKIIILRGKINFSQYLILPIFFINSVFFYSSLLSSRLLSLGLLLISVLFLFYYYKSSIKYYFAESDKKKNLPLWSNLFAFLTIFFGSAFVYSLPYFIRVDNWLLIICLNLILFLAFFQSMYIEKFPIKTIVFFSVLFLFCLNPLFWSLFLLPFDFNVLAFIISLVYYLSLSFVVFYLKKELSFKKIKYNIGFFIFILLLVFLGISWR